MESGEAVAEEAGSPGDDGVARAAELAGNGAVRGSLAVGDPQDQSGAEGEGLRGGGGPREGEQLATEFVGEGDGGSSRDGHGGNPAEEKRGSQHSDRSPSTSQPDCSETCEMDI